MNRKQVDLKVEFLEEKINPETLYRLRTNNKEWIDWETDQFKALLISLFEKAEIPNKYINKLLSEKYISLFITSFTHPSMGGNNYEIFEFLGDLSYNKIVGYYIVRKFKQLFDPEAIGVLSRLKIHIIQSKKMSSMAFKLGLNKFIRYNPLNPKTGVIDINKLAEDVFESLFGVLEWILDEEIGIGAGNIFCYKLVSKLLDEYDFTTLNYTDIVDPYTILKEIFDKNKQYLGTQNITYTKLEDRIIATITTSSKNEILGRGEGKDQNEAKNSAANQAINNLKKKGYVHPDLNKYDKYIVQ